MSDVSVSDGEFVVDAALIGRAFRIDIGEVRKDMRTGRITTRCETGIDEDAGRWRLTFYREGRALRLVVDAEGTLLSKGTFPVDVSGP